MHNFRQIVEKLQQNQVVAYPTEAVFGLGCNPNSEQAVRKLLALKQRSEQKGLILIAPTVEFLEPYIDTARLSENEWQQLTTVGSQAITWVVPARASVPSFLTGQFNSIAVRLCTIPAVVELCQAVRFALTSSSANLSGFAPCRTAQQVRDQFGENFPVLEAETGGKQQPSEIRDIFTQHIFRQG